MRDVKRSPMPRKRATPRRTKATRRCAGSSRCRTAHLPVHVSDTEWLCAKHATWEADRLVGDFVKARDGRCILASFTDKPCFSEDLYWCHLIPKGRYYATRWHPLNAVAGCLSHHRAFDEAPREKEAWCRRHLGEDTWKALDDVAKFGAAPSAADVIVEFRARLAA